MRVISAVFHPLLMTTYTSVLLYLVMPSIFSPVPLHAIPFFLLAVFVSTFVMPAISILFMKFTKRISSLELTNREERLLPFVTIACFYGVSCYLFYVKMNLTASFSNMMVTATVLIVLLLVISLAYKISIHAAAIWSLCGSMSALSVKYLDQSVLVYLVIVFLCAGITCTSRLYLNRHSPAQVWLGSVVGFFFCLLSTYFLV
jgi:hypothetical protein